MDYLWTPWRYVYVSGVDQAKGCIFCQLLNLGDDEKALIVHRGKFQLRHPQRFPLHLGSCNGRPYEHVDRLNLLPEDAANEMMALTRRLETDLIELYHPDGVNLGMNIGKAAGAGVAGHIHMHVLPRWVADANFMTVIGETRVLPETLDETYRRLREKF